MRDCRAAVAFFLVVLSSIPTNGRTVLRQNCYGNDFASAKKEIAGHGLSAPWRGNSTESDLTFFKIAEFSKDDKVLIVAINHGKGGDQANGYWFLPDGSVVVLIGNRYAKKFVFTKSPLDWTDGIEETVISVVEAESSQMTNIRVIHPNSPSWIWPWVSPAKVVYETPRDIVQTYSNLSSLNLGDLKLCFGVK